MQRGFQITVIIMDFLNKNRKVAELKLWEIFTKQNVEQINYQFVNCYVKPRLDLFIYYIYVLVYIFIYTFNI